MMNRAMLPYLEQLPRVCLMHDAWLALLASCFGRIGWVGQPLYLYRQHRDNTLGAEKGDSLKGAGARIKDGGRAKENYRLMSGRPGACWTCSMMSWIRGRGRYCLRLRNFREKAGLGRSCL